MDFGDLSIPWQTEHVEDRAGDILGLQQSLGSVRAPLEGEEAVSTEGDGPRQQRSAEGHGSEGDEGTVPEDARGDPGSGAAPRERDEMENCSR